MAKKVAVIGSGVMGLSSALQLHDRGWEVTILERDRPAAGASSAANGALTPHSDHSVAGVVSAMALDSVDLYPALLERLRGESGMPIDVDGNGVLEVMLNAEELEAGESAFAAMRQKGWEVDWLEATDVLRLEPRVSGRACGGIWYKRETGIDVQQLIAALLHLVARRCTLSFPVTVTSVVNNSSSVEVSTTTGSTFFDAAVICTGSSMPRVDNLPSINLTRIRGELLEAWAPPGLISRCIYRGDGFVTPRRDGRLLLGTSYDIQTPDMDENRETISVGTAIKTLAANCETVPAFRMAQLRRVWKCWRSFTSDEIPALGRYGGERVVVALGLGGLGFTLAASTSRLVADLVDGDASDPWLSTLDPMRSGLKQQP